MLSAALCAAFSVDLRLLKLEHFVKGSTEISQMENLRHGREWGFTVGRGRQQARQYRWR